jgi:hypothetical protein
MKHTNAEKLSVRGQEEGMVSFVDGYNTLTLDFNFFLNASISSCYYFSSYKFISSLGRKGCVSTIKMSKMPKAIRKNITLVPSPMF